MDELLVGKSTYSIRRATREDVPDIVTLLRDDALGATREREVLEPYKAAFDAINCDPSHTLVVVQNNAGAVVAAMQLTLLHGLARGGATRLQIEGVRVGGIGSRYRSRNRPLRMGPWFRCRARSNSSATHHRQGPQGRSPIL